MILRTSALVVTLTAALSAQTYDLLLKGGHLIDPKNNIDAIRDVAIRAGKVAAVGENLPAAQAKKIASLQHEADLLRSLARSGRDMIDSPGWGGQARSGDTGSG